MRALRNVSIALLMLALSVAQPPAAASEEPAEVPEVAGAAALGALEDSLTLVRRSKNYELMGLGSRAEISQANLGAPLRVHEWGYDKLVAYRKGDDTDVTAGPEQLLYPVTVGGEVRSSITLARDGDDWRLTTYGDAGRTLEIEKTRLGAAQVAGAGGDATYSLVSVPAFNLYFVATTRGGRTTLSPVEASVPADLELAGEIEEGELVERLSAYAKAFDAEYGEDIRKRQLVN